MNRQRTIIVENAGPVAHLEIPVQPGATILRGCSDIGKSETIKAVSRLAGGREDVTCTAGEAQGFVEGFGVRQRFWVRQLFQPPAHALGVVEPVLGRVHRCLYPPVRDGHLA